MMPIDQWLKTHEANNLHLCASAARAFRVSKDPIIIKFECWDKKEADWFRRVMETQYPDVKFFCSWYEFGKDFHRPELITG